MSHYLFIPIHKCPFAPATVIDTLTIENSQFEIIFFQNFVKNLFVARGLRALRLRADSYDLRIPRGNLTHPIRGSQLSVHKQSSSVH